MRVRVRVLGLIATVAFAVACSPFASTNAAPPTTAELDGSAPLPAERDAAFDGSDAGGLALVCKPTCASFEGDQLPADAEKGEGNGGTVAFVQDDLRNSRVIEATIKQQSNASACLEVPLGAAVRVRVSVDVRIMTTGVDAFDLINLRTREGPTSEVTLEVDQDRTLKLDTEVENVSSDSLPTGAKLDAEWTRLELTLTKGDSRVAIEGSVGGIPFSPTTTGPNVLLGALLLEVGECDTGSSTKSWAVRFDDLDVDAR